MAILQQFHGNFAAIYCDFEMLCSGSSRRNKLYPVTLKPGLFWSGFGGIDFVSLNFVTSLYFTIKDILSDQRGRSHQFCQSYTQELSISKSKKKKKRKKKRWTHIRIATL